METLYIIRGCSGSGKSTFAKMLADALKINYYEADMFHYKKDDVTGEWKYDWKPENIQKAHQECQKNVEFEMMNDFSVIVSNTSTSEKELKPYLDLAEKYSYRVVSLIAENRHGGTNQHDVPEETLARQEHRLRGSIKLR